MQPNSTIPQTPPQITQNMPEMPSPDEPMVGGKREKKSEGWKSVFSTLFIVISAPIIALLLINFVFQSYEVDGPSMEKTLQNADRLIVWKVPKTISKIRGTHYIPNRGDIIIFTKSDSFDNHSVGGEKQLIKRVIGLPGDRVVVKNGKVTVYNDENPSGFNPDENNKLGNVSYTSNDTDVTVNENEVFVLGDNRANSLDSRVFGPISSDTIVGKLEFRIFPFNTFEQF